MLPPPQNKARVSWVAIDAGGRRYDGVRCIFRALLFKIFTIGRHRICLGRAVCGMFFLLLFSACAAETPAQIEWRRIIGLSQDISKHARACASGFEGKPEYTRIRSKIAIATGSGLPTAVQLTDPDPPTEGDVVQILNWNAEDTVCQREGIQDAGRIDPELMRLLIKANESWNYFLVDVMRNHSITYGQINAKILKIKQEIGSEGRAWGGRLRTRIASQHVQQLAIQKAERDQFWSEVGNVAREIAEGAIVVVAAYSDSQSAISTERAQFLLKYQTNRPVKYQPTTSCQWVGSIWRCSSY